MFYFLNYIKKDFVLLNFALRFVQIEVQAAIALELSSEGPVSIHNDALAKVLGKERPGRVRGFGGGVTSSKIDAQQQFASWKAKLEEKVETMEERYSRLERAIYNLVSGDIS